MAPMKKILAAVAVAIAVGMTGLPAQQEIWRYWPHLELIALPRACGDHDGDLVQDVLILATNGPGSSSSYMEVRILSGVTGSLLYQHLFAGPSAVGGFTYLGDVDCDGFGEFAITMDPGSPCCLNRLEVWSPRLDRRLWFATGAYPTHYGHMTTSANLDADTNMEVVTSTSYQGDHRVFAYDHDGTPLWVTDIRQVPTEQVRGLGNIGDIDGDGIDDIGVGLVEATGRGGVRILSGADGTVLRTDYGAQPGDALGYRIVRFGDLDLDGVVDYAVSNRFGYPRGVITVISGGNGRVLREWVAGPNLGETLLAGFDLDLDGVPDVFAGGPFYFNGYVGPSPYLGRIQALSGRDGGVLWDEQNWPSTEPGVGYFADRYLGLDAAYIGRVGSNPYPVIVVFDFPFQTVGGFGYQTGRLRAIRVGLVGTDASGPGCASGGMAPQIAVRRGVAGGTQVTLAGAAPGALAFLMVGHANESSWHGMSLPLQLDPLGFAGCRLLVPPELVLTRAAGTVGNQAGFATFDVPLSVAANGYPVAVQWLVLDPAALGYALSLRHGLRLQ